MIGGDGWSPRRWVLLDGNRFAVTALILVLVFLTLGPVGHLLTTPTGEVAHNPRPLLTTLLSGIFLLVSIVVSINSLVVSQEQTPLGQQRDRIQRVGQFRRDLEETVDEPISPTEPSRLLQILTGSVVKHLQELADQMEDSSDEVQAALSTYISETTDRTSAVSEHLESATGTVDLMVASMDYQYSRQATELRRIRTEYADEFSPEATETIDTILDTMEYIATAREYFKTLYFEQEFARLSKYLVYVSLAAMVLVAFTIVHLGALPEVHPLITAIQAVALAPFALLSAYVVRVATIANQTRADGEFAFRSVTNGEDGEK